VRLGRQLLTESTFIGVLGGVLGLAFGMAGLQLVRGMGLENLPRGTEVAVGGTVQLDASGSTDPGVAGKED